KHLPAGRHLEALFGARLGLELGHLALLCGDSHGLMSGRPDFARLSVLIVHFPSPRQPFRLGGGRAALWQTLERNTTVTRVLAPIQGSPGPPRAARPTNHHCSLGVACRGIRPFGALWRALCDRGAGNPAPRNPRAAVAPVPRGRGLRTPGDRLPLLPFQAEFGGGRPRPPSPSSAAPRRSGRGLGRLDV